MSGLFVAAVADEIIAAVMSLADVGVAAVFLAYPFAAVQHLPMQAVQADTVIKSPVIALHHVRKEISFMLRFLPGLTCPGGSGIWAWESETKKRPGRIRARRRKLVFITILNGHCSGTRPHRRLGSGTGPVCRAA